MGSDFNRDDFLNNSGLFPPKADSESESECESVKSKYQIPNNKIDRPEPPNTAKKDREE